MQLDAGAGPCVECFETGAAVVVTDIDVDGTRWPEFRQEALAQGFRSVYAAPMRLRGRIIGTVNLLVTRAGSLSDVDSGAIQSLADAATIAILQERLLRESAIITADEALNRMRSFARASNRTLQDVAEAIANRTLVIGSPH